MFGYKVQIPNRNYFELPEKLVKQLKPHRNTRLEIIYRQYRPLIEISWKTSVSDKNRVIIGHSCYLKHLLQPGDKVRLHIIDKNTILVRKSIF